MKKFSLRHRFKTFLFFEGTVIGIFTGAIIALLRFLIDLADDFRPTWFADLSFAKFLLTLCGIFFVAIFLSKAMNFENQVGGSGIPQVKSILQGNSKMQNPLRLLILKFVSIILAISSGMSLGRAGVSIQFGACIGSIFSKIFHSKLNNNFIEGKFLFTAGAGAGFAAVFNAPLAGVIFCIEELHRKFNAEFLIATISATVSADVVVGIIFGVRPIFETITKTPPIIYSTDNLKIFLCFIILGILIGIIGAFFTKSLILSLNIFEKINCKKFYKILFAMLLIIPLGKFYPQVLSCGNILVDELLSSKFILSLLIILLLGKFLFTLICFGTNSPGGIFLPLLTVGALCGNIFANIGINLNLFAEAWTTLFIIFGMAAMFAAVVKAPVTGSVLILELTGKFSYLSILILISGVAFIISDLCGGEPIFSALQNRKKFVK